MKNASQLTRSFMAHHKRWRDTERDWIRSVFGAVLRVARRNSEFTVDEIWNEIDRMASRGKLPKSRIDHRVLGPMLRHMAAEGMLGSSGYYTKSTRMGGGSRPVTIWDSYVTARAVA